MLGNGFCFEMTEEQKLIKDLAGDFAEKEMKPLVRYFDDFGNTAEAQDKLKVLRKKASKTGLLGLGLPEEYSGTKSSSVTLGIVCEELGKRGVCFSLLEPPGIFIAYPIMNWGTKEQKDLFLPKLIKGE